MADRNIDRGIDRNMATRIPARVRALPMPVHVLVVGDRVVNALVAVVDTAAADVPGAVMAEAMVTVAAGIRVTKQSLQCSTIT